MAKPELALHSTLCVAVIAACLAPVGSVAADEIYHWIDEEGAVHYSDKRPTHDAPVTVLEIENSPSIRYDATEDPYSILNQAARVHENWLELEAVRQERVQQRIDARESAPPPQRNYDEDYDGSYLGYSSYYPYYAYWGGNGSDYQRGLARDQAYALHTLDLIGPRPASINSGFHQERVNRSQFLPLVPPAPVVHPVAQPLAR